MPGSAQRWMLLPGSIVLLMMVLVGCQVLQQPETVVVEEYLTEQPSDVFISRHYHQLQPRRIILTIPRNWENDYEVNARFVDALRRHLARLGIFDVVLNTGVCDVSIQSIKRGTFNERKLWEITKQYNADGIMICEVFSFSAYEPLKLGCSLTFVDTRESIVTLFTSGFWDTTKPNVFNKFRQHVCRTHQCKHYAAGMYLRSPAEFIDFVSLDLAEFLDSRLRHVQQPAPMHVMHR